MIDLTDEIISSTPKPAELQRTWGKVTVASPLEVKIAGDTEATRVTLGCAGYTPAVDDVVLLWRVGIDKWAAVDQLVAR